MQTLDAKFGALAAHQDRQRRHTTSRPSVLWWAIASVLIAAPLPAIAMSVPSNAAENIADTQSDTVFGNELTQVDKDGRFSIRYRMKVK